MAKDKNCTAITTAEAYNLFQLRHFFPNAVTFKDESECVLLAINDGHALIFGFGCAVFWNVSEKDIKDTLKTIKPCETDPYRTRQESFRFEFAKESKVINDCITLVNDKTLSLQLLTVSYGFAQSLKLSVFEEKLELMIKTTANIPKQLADKGRISMRSRAINKHIGSLLVAKHRINIHSDMLDSPNFLWDNPEYEDLYKQTVNDQDLSPRLHVLNTRLDIVGDLFHLLGEELKNRHTLFLELTIVILISIEIVISLIEIFT